MADQNHLQNAGKSVGKAAKNATRATTEGRLADAAESAWEGTTTAATEIGKSALDMAGKAKDTVQNFMGGTTARAQGAINSAMAGRPVDAAKTVVDRDED